VLFNKIQIEDVLKLEGIMNNLNGVLNGMVESMLEMDWKNFYRYLGVEEVCEE